MTPSARIATAIELLDSIVAGAPAEQALTTWARKSRFAGSGDRAAIRDLVYDVLRCRRSYAWIGGAETGRGLMIGALRSQDIDLASLFTGVGYAPAPLGSTESQTRDLENAPQAVQSDVPDWLMADLGSSLGEDMAPVLAMMRHRAPVFLRVNQRTVSRADAALQLQKDGIQTSPHPLSPTALKVDTDARKVASSYAFLTGLVEIQDVASQAVTDSLPLARGMRVLDYCAGGGGKALAMAARVEVTVFAHDIDAARMRDIPARAARAGVQIRCLDGAEVAKAAPFDLVLCDVPCSGSGAWRRSPDAKWRLTRTRLDQLCALQAEVLDQAALLVTKNGFLAYATCSLLDAENRDQITSFIKRHPEWTQVNSQRFTPLDGGDGFFLALLCRLTDRP